MEQFEFSNFFPETDYDRMVDVEEKPAKTSSLRPDIRLFITKSKNKEGINIEDDDIHHVYIESHYLPDIKQIAGRIRSGAKHVYIIVDSNDYSPYALPYETLLAEYLVRPISPENVTPCINL